MSNMESLREQVRTARLIRQTIRVMVPIGIGLICLIALPRKGHGQQVITNGKIRVEIFIGGTDTTKCPCETKKIIPRKSVSKAPAKLPLVKKDLGESAIKDALAAAAPKVIQMPIPAPDPTLRVNGLEDIAKSARDASQAFVVLAQTNRELVQDIMDRDKRPVIPPIIVAEKRNNGVLYALLGVAIAVGGNAIYSNNRPDKKKDVVNVNLCTSQGTTRVCEKTGGPVNAPNGLRMGFRLPLP